MKFEKAPDTSGMMDSATVMIVDNWALIAIAGAALVILALATGTSKNVTGTASRRRRRTSGWDAEGGDGD